MAEIHPVDVSVATSIVENLTTAAITNEEVRFYFIAIPKRAYTYYASYTVKCLWTFLKNFLPSKKRGLGRNKYHTSSAYTTCVKVTLFTKPTPSGLTNLAFILWLLYILGCRSVYIWHLHNWAWVTIFLHSVTTCFMLTPWVEKIIRDQEES